MVGTLIIINFKKLDEKQNNVIRLLQRADKLQNEIELVSNFILIQNKEKNHVCCSMTRKLSKVHSVM